MPHLHKAEIQANDGNDGSLEQLNVAHFTRLSHHYVFLRSLDPPPVDDPEDDHIDYVESEERVVEVDDPWIHMTIVLLFVDVRFIGVCLDHRQH
jgi:hypothetical protein